ncbi:MAG: SPOR domain-containing protein [Steroidobacter sp.]
MARDYKNAKRSGSKSMSASGGFALGISLGLMIAFGVHFYDLRSSKNASTNAKAAPLSGEHAKEQADTPAPESAQDNTHYDFYDVLPKFEVVVPNQKKDPKKPGDSAAGSIDTPGTYVLQVGSWRNFADADRVRAQLALQGIESNIQKVSVDADTWHRVRIGPITDLKKLEDTRRKLREAQIDAMVIRMGK